jgi:hypothetical protein
VIKYFDYENIGRNIRTLGSHVFERLFFSAGLIGNLGILFFTNLKCKKCYGIDPRTRLFLFQPILCERLSTYIRAVGVCITGFAV